MESTTYAVEAVVERTHWWFVVRRWLLARTIRSLGLAHEANILDVGTSTGTNLRLLSELGFNQFQGLDSNQEAIRYCAEKGLGSVMQGDATNLPFADGSFDLVLATDIIEHVEDDALAVRELARVLRPGGHLILTVPTFKALWGLQDEIAHHKRRYQLRDVLHLTASERLDTIDAFYFNYILFVPIWVARRVIDMLGIRLMSEAQVNTPWLNSLLEYIFMFDVRTARLLHPPFGVSGLVVTRKHPPAEKRSHAEASASAEGVSGGPMPRPLTQHE